MLIVSPPEVGQWKPDWYWFSPKERIWIESKRQLLDTCKQKGKVSLGYG